MPTFILTGGTPVHGPSLGSYGTSPVLYPSISESHVRAVYQVLSYFFDGNTHILGGSSIALPELTAKNIVQDIRDICIDTPMPLLGLLDANVLSEEEVHCKVGSVDGYERRIKLMRKVLAVVPFDAADSGKNYRGAVRLYDSVFTIFATQHAAFAARNIFNPQMEAIPTQIPNEEFCIASGNLVCEVRSRYTRDV